MGSFSSHIRLACVGIMVLGAAVAGLQTGDTPQDRISKDTVGLPGLVGYWNFDDCLADDLSVSKHISFVSISNLTLACNAGVVGKAYRFRGVQASDHLEVENTPPMMLSEGSSINIWFKLLSNRSHNGDHGETDFGTQVLISKSSDRTGISVRMEREPTDALWYAYVSNGRCCVRAPSKLPAVKFGQGGVAVGDWHMITLTFDPQKSVRLYLDGKTRSVIKSDVYNLNPQTDLEPLIIGAESKGKWYPFDGDIDEVRVYDRPLTVTEISKLFAQGKQVTKR